MAYNVCKLYFRTESFNLKELFMRQNWMRRFTIPTLSLLLIAVLVSITGCAHHSGGGNQITIGAYGAETGPQATFGSSMQMGMNMAIDEANAAGGINGVKVAGLMYDDESKADQARTVVSKLVDEDNVTAILGEVTSTNTLAAAPVCQTNKVPMVSPAATNPKVTMIGDYIFRTCFIDPFQGAVMSTFATRTLHAKTAAVFFDNSSDYAKGLKTFFENKFKSQGGQIVIEQSYDTKSGTGDYRAQLTTIKESEPDIIYIPGYYGEVGTIAQQARQLGIKSTFLGGDGWDSQALYAGANGALEGSYYSNHYSPDSTQPAVVNFSKAFEAKYSQGVPDAMAALGYDATNVIIAAIRTAGTPADGDYSSADYHAKVRDALAATKNFPGVAGTITIGPDRNAIKPAVILEVKGNKSVYVTTITPLDVGL
jgi:branched-chain amino acid transport system substrate-binding protein